MALIEIDGSPIENDDFPWQTPRSSHHTGMLWAQVLGYPWQRGYNMQKMHGIPKVKHYALILYQLFVITKREAAIIRAYMQDEVWANRIQRVLAAGFKPAPPR